MMRIVIDSLVAVMLAGILVVAVTFYRNSSDLEDQVRGTQQSVRSMEREVLLQAALEDVPCTEQGYPEQLDPEWFPSNPRNELLAPGHPWLEIADLSRRHLEHPPDRIARDKSVAQFWYNPYTGRIRARVPGGMPDSQALRLYNAVNVSNLPALFTAALDEGGQPTLASE